MGPAPARAGEILDALPVGVVVVGDDHLVLDSNAKARELMPVLEAGLPLRCHELLRCDGPGEPCERACLATRALEAESSMPEVRIDVTHAGAPGAVWVTAAPLRSRKAAILHLRAGRANDRRRRSEPHWLTDPELRIHTLGRTSVEAGPTSLGGQWLGERPGQVLKYLVCHRQLGATADAIAEAIWPDSGPGVLGSARHAIHRLRDKLEPARTKHGHSSFVVGTAGGYALDRRNIWIDVDEFEREVQDGMAALRALEPAIATNHLSRASELYVGEFLPDEPYADWAFDERSRLHALATRAVRTLAILAYERDDSSAALGHLERLCAIEPYDESAHRDLIGALFSAGQLGDARRRYMAFAQRIRREFQEVPGFDLKSLRAAQQRQARAG
jgi:DNA-binding SARP family transcriptional activator